MPDMKIIFYRMKWILGNFPIFWKTLSKVNQLALVLVPLGLVMSLLKIPLSDLVFGISLGIFVTQYIQRTEDEKR